MCKYILFFLVFLESLTFANNKKPLAFVSDLQGEAVVLRNPVLQKNPEFDRRVNSKLHQVSYYMGKYWEVYAINHGTSLYFGDLVSTRAKSSLHLTIHSAQNIHLAENTVIQILPNFIQMLLEQVASPTIYVVGGKLRVQSTSSPRFNKFNIRSSSMELELKQADILFAVNGKMSRLVSIEGEALARRVTTESQKTYLQSLEAYRKRNFRELTRLTTIKHRQGLEEPTRVVAGNKLESWEELNQQDRTNLLRLLGAEKSKSYLETASRFELVTTRGEDLKFFEALLPEIDRLLQDIDFSFISDDDIPEDLFLLDVLNSDEDLTDLSSQMPYVEPLDKLFSIHVSYIDILNEFNDSYSFKSKALALELEIRPWRYMYTYLAISSGVADPENMAGFLGLGAPQALNSYSHVAMGAGGRVILWRRLALTLGAGIMHMQQLSVQYDDLPSNVNRTYTISLDPIPVGELGMSLNFLGDMEIFLRYGIGSSFADVEAKDISSAYKSAGSLSYGTIGLGWNTN
ncbi:MAG: hypothetical protein ACOH5I_09105 [Oligoflexus sp.]